MDRWACLLRGDRSQVRRSETYQICEKIEMTRRLTTEQKWLRSIRWIRVNFPPPYPARIRSKRMKDCGDTTYSEDMEDFKIRIKSSQSFAMKIDTLLHEYAHCLTWFGAESELEDHSGEWGLTYARLYRKFIEWDYGKNQKKRKRAVGPLPSQKEFDF